MRFASIEKLAKKMIADVESTDDSVSAILLYPETCELLTELVKHGYFVASCELSNPLLNGYAGEYLVTITDCEIFVEPVFDENSDLRFDDTYDKVTYVYEDCDSKVLRILNNANYVFELAQEDKEENEDVPLFAMFESWYGEYAENIIDLTEKQIQSLIQELSI